MKNRVSAAAAFAVACLKTALVAAATYEVTADRPDCIYRCGETASFTVKVLSTNGMERVPENAVARLDNFGPRVLAEVPFDAAATGAVFTVSGTLEEPGFLRLSLPWTEKPFKDPAAFSVGFEPEKIRKGSPSPEDFDEFWAEARARLAREVPLDARMERVVERSTDKFDFYRISFATFGRRVHGYMSVPADKSKAPFPVDVDVYAAGFGDWTNDMQGDSHSIRVQFGVYPFAPDWRWKEMGLDAAFNDMEAGLKARYGVQRYCQAGISESREEYFFYPVLLGLDRAIDWIAALPEVDRSRIRYQGTSQGGGIGLWLCGLNHAFTRAAFYVPALTDTMGYLAGRESGWPKIVENNSGTPERRAGAEKWAPYFDAANFASRIRCPVRIAVGFSDTICPPCAIYAAYNEIKVADKAIANGIGMTHSCSGRFYDELGKWVRRDGAAARLKARLLEIGKSPRYCWAWTYPWIDHKDWSGDMRFVVESDGAFMPKPLEEVSLECEYQTYSGGQRALLNYADLASIAGTWHSDRYYAVNRAGLAAAAKKQWREFGGVMVFGWHMDHPYCTNGHNQASYRFKSEGVNSNVVRQILDGTGGPCGNGCVGQKREPFATPREWFLASLDEVALFFNTLVDEETGGKIPVILRYPHEMDGNWFWWGRGWCEPDEYRRLCRLEANYLRERCLGQILFAYTPDRTWRDFGEEGGDGNTFLAYYPGDGYVDIIGIDDYTIGHGDDAYAELALAETVCRLRQMTAFAKERGHVVAISESGGKDKRYDFWTFLHRAATADGVECAFVNTWAGTCGTTPETPEEAEDQRIFANGPSVILESLGEGFR